MTLLIEIAASFAGLATAEIASGGIIDSIQVSLRNHRSATEK